MLWRQPVRVISMTVEPHTQAILLLTARFNKTSISKASNSKEKPLTPTEWGRFAQWLNQQKLTPESLLTGNFEDKLASWSDKKITKERIEYLLNRGSALALALEKWLRAGLWVITRADADYPIRFKKHLKYDSPAVLFGCGNRALLNEGGIAVVGSRKTSDEDLNYSRELGIKAANQGYSIVSGGARGIDEAAMLGALDAEGTVIGVLADSLLRATSSAKYRKHLMSHNLVLISPFYPEAGFNVGNAMQRNKYIYCLSNAAVAVHSGTKGGTWTGVIENINKNRVPMWVKKTTDKESGNAALVEKGAQWLTANINEVDFEVLTKPIEIISKSEPEDLFNQPVSSVRETEDNQVYDLGNKPSTEKIEQPNEKEAKSEKKTAKDKQKKNKEDSDETKQSSKEVINLEVSFYHLFLNKAEQFCKLDAKTTDELVEVLGLNKTQLNTWLKQAVTERKLIKLKGPVRYQWHENQQESLFE